MDQCVGTYKYNGDTVFTLSVGADFSIGFLGWGQRDTDAGLPFKLRFDSLPARDKVVVLPKTDDVTYGEWLMKDLRFYLRRAQAPLPHVLYMANASENNGSLSASVSDGRADRLSVDESHSGLCYLQSSHIPDAGYYGRDFEQLAQIIFPRGYLRFTGLDEGDPDATVAQASLAEAALFDAGALAPEAALYSSHVSPLVRIVSAGSAGQRLALNTVNPAAPIWRFASETLGQLVPDGRFCSYIPQDDGGVRYGQNPLTRKDAALLDTLKRNPVDIVRIITGFTLLPYYSTMIVLNAQPTHYFKIAAVGNKLKLNFCYVGWGTGEQEVPLEETDWKVLAGDGSVSGGVFTAGGVSKFSVLQAIHRNPTYMQFAVVIIPMPLLTAAEFVAMRNGG